MSLKKEDTVRGLGEEKEENLGYEEERTPPGPKAPGSHAADPDKVVAQSSRAPKGPHPVHKPSAHEEREETWTSGLRPRRPGAGGAGPTAPLALGRTATNRGPVGGEARDHLLPRGGGGVRRNDEVDQVRTVPFGHPFIFLDIDPLMEHGPDTSDSLMIPLS